MDEDPKKDIHEDDTLSSTQSQQEVRIKMPTKEEIMRKQFILEQMLPILESALQYLDQFSGADLIIGLGNTGCDLSALINSLMIGPQTPPDVEIDVQSDDQKGESLLP